MHVPFASLVLKHFLRECVSFTKPNLHELSADFSTNTLPICSSSAAQPELLIWLSCSGFLFSQSFVSFWGENSQQEETGQCRSRKALSPNSYKLPLDFNCFPPWCILLSFFH